jgi:CubicO group peptidase (beta-lactamase class C family)
MRPYNEGDASVAPTIYGTAHVKLNGPGEIRRDPPQMQALTSLLLLSLAAAAMGCAASPARLSEAEAIKAFKAELEAQAADGRFSGAILVARAGKPIFQQAYGYADRDRKIRNRIDTKFRIGSMGKMFTAVAVLQLVQDGKIKLDDSIAHYLPDYPNREVTSVTIHHLLTHTGGTGDIFSPDFDAHRTQLKSLADYVALYGPIPSYLLRRARRR